MSRTVEDTHARFCIEEKKKEKKEDAQSWLEWNSTPAFSVSTENTVFTTQIKRLLSNNSLSPSPSHIYPTPRWFFFTKAKIMLEQTSRMAFLDMISICYVIDKNRAKNQVGKNLPQTHNQI